MSCVIMGEGSSQHVTTLKSLVTIGILIIKRKNASHQKHESYKYGMPLKNWVDWITTRREKNVANTQKWYILRRSAGIKTNILFTLLITFYNFTLNPIQDGFFWGYSRMWEEGGGGVKRLPTFLKSVTHILQWWNLTQLYLN